MYPVIQTSDRRTRANPYRTVLLQVLGGPGDASKVEAVEALGLPRPQASQKSTLPDSRAAGDNSGPHTVRSAEGKAFTSAAMGRDTAGLTDFIASKPANDGMRDMDSRMIIQAGGLPIKFDQALVAGIGVGGAPSGDIDAGCAAAGLKAIGAQ